MSGYEFVSCRSAKDQRLPAGTIATALQISPVPKPNLILKTVDIVSLVLRLLCRLQ